MVLPHTECWAVSLGEEKYCWDRTGNIRSTSKELPKRGNAIGQLFMKHLISPQSILYRTESVIIGGSRHSTISLPEL